MRHIFLISNNENNKTWKFLSTSYIFIESWVTDLYSNDYGIEYAVLRIFMKGESLQGVTTLHATPLSVACDLSFKGNIANRRDTSGHVRSPEF